MLVTFLGVFEVGCEAESTIWAHGNAVANGVGYAPWRGPRANASPHAAGTVDQAFLDIHQDSFPRVLAADWTVTLLDDDPGFTERLLGDGRADDSAPNEYVYVSEGTAPPTPETPSEARVPEPTTLALLGERHDRNGEGSAPQMESLRDARPSHRSRANRRSRVSPPRVFFISPSVRPGTAG